MFFTRTHKYQFQVPKNEIKHLLIGDHVKIHNLDFEVYEKDHSLRIIPHAEQVNAIKTLPITHVELHEMGDRTKVTVTSKMRKLDSGGPLLIVIFCTFLFLASFILLYVGGERSITYTMLTMGTLIFTVFWVRMEMGYFDYVRKIRSFVKNKVQIPA